MKVERIEVNGVMMTRGEWRDYMSACPHPKFSYPDVELMDGSKMAICERCKYVQHAPIAKIIEQEAN